MKKVAKLLLASVLAVSPMVGFAVAHAQNTTEASTPADDQLVTLTVHEAWVQSGRNEDKFFDMVQRLTALSAQKRGVTLPDNEATGRKIGMMIKTSGRRDPDQLLYAVVDAAVKRMASGKTEMQ